MAADPQRSSNPEQGAGYPKVCCNENHIRRDAHGGGGSALWFFISVSVPSGTTIF